MSSVSQWYWDGEWHPYPKNKQPMKVEILPLPDGFSFSLPQPDWEAFRRSIAEIITRQFTLSPEELEFLNPPTDERNQVEMSKHTSRFTNPPKTAS